MLRVHQPGLAGRHTEKRRVESCRVVHETRTTGHNLARHTGFGVEEFVDIPPVLGHLGYRIAALAKDVPELFCICRPWKTRRVADDRERWLLLISDGCHAVVLSSWGL